MATTIHFMMPTHNSAVGTSVRDMMNKILEGTVEHGHLFGHGDIATQHQYPSVVFDYLWKSGRGAMHFFGETEHQDTFLLFQYLNPRFIDREITIAAHNDASISIGDEINRLAISQMVINGKTVKLMIKMPDNKSAFMDNQLLKPLIASNPQ